MVQIATLSAVIRLDNKKFKRDINETKSSLGQLSKGLERGSLNAEKLGGALAERFLGGAAAISLATAALHNFAQAGREAQLKAGLNPADQPQGGWRGFFEEDVRDFLEGIPIYGDFVKGGGVIKGWAGKKLGVGNAYELQKLNEELARFPELEKRLNARIEEGRRKRQLNAQLQDTLTGTNTATRNLALSKAERELSALEFRIDDIKELAKAKPGRAYEVSPGQTFQRRGGSTVADRQAEYLKQILETMQRDGIRVNLNN